MQTETKDIASYIKMVTGMNVEVSIEKPTEDTIIVECNQIDELEELLASWCTYHNCFNSSNQGMMITGTTKNKVSIREVIIGSTGKSICHSSNGVYLYKVYSIQITADGKLRKKALRYSIEIKDSKEKYDANISKRGMALKIYKSLIHDVQYKTEELTGK